MHIAYIFFFFQINNVYLKIFKKLRKMQTNILKELHSYLKFISVTFNVS